MIGRYLLGKDWIIMSAPPRVHPGNGETVSFIGAGRVGMAFADALGAAGYDLVSMVSLTGRGWTSRMFPDVGPVPAYGIARGDIVIIAIPDDKVAGLAEGLVRSGAVRPGQFIVHTSGAHGIAPLRPVAEKGALIAAVHPAMTITAGVETTFEGVTFGVTAEEGPARERAAKLVKDLGGIIQWIDESNRALYHAALTHGANHLVTLVNEARDRLRDAGVEHPERVLRPLLQAALDNSLAQGDGALTGPVSRGDAGTIAGHLAALAATAPESLPPYLALARRTADRAVAAGRLRPVAAVPLFEVLEATRESV